MKILMRTLLVIVALVVIAAAASFFLPSSYKVERSASMKARPKVVFSYLNDLKRWPEWTAWTKDRFPDMNVSFAGPESGVGATYSWEGGSVGKGTLKITGSDPAKGIDYDLDFQDGKYLSKGTLKLAEEGDLVKVTWTNEGALGNNPINRYFGLLMDKFMGPDFETGLKNLQQRVESK
jgi:hypothetical protein